MRIWAHHRGLLKLGLAVLIAAGPTNLLTATVAAPNTRPSRIVSINLCTDQLLLDLVPRERIAALSYLAVDPVVSAAAEEARGIKTVRGLAEEVLALQPDVVLAQEYSTVATVALLQRLGFRVVLVPLASDFEGLRRGIRIVAAAVGEAARGEALISAFDKKIADMHTPGGSRPTAVAYQVNSLASGEGSLVDAVLEAAGFHNIARDRALGPGGRLPLETLLMAPPDLVVLANSPGDFRSIVADNLRHPAFADLLRRRPNVHLPMPLWMCATPRIADAVERLGSIREEIAAQRGKQ